MARVEADREDLMREATALERRAEFAGPGDVTPAVLGLRKNGALSLFLSPERCYHFDPCGQLRRAFVDGHLYRTQGKTLARLKRVRQTDVTELRRHDLSPEESARFLLDCQSHILAFIDRFDRGEIICTRQVPAEPDVAAEIIRMIRHVLKTSLELAPAFRGKP